jgi:hypothetical protein
MPDEPRYAENTSKAIQPRYRCREMIIGYMKTTLCNHLSAFVPHCSFPCVTPRDEFSLLIGGARLESVWRVTPV